MRETQKAGKDVATRAELAEWVRLYAKDLFAWAFRKTADAGLSEDLVQETYLAALESLSKFNRQSHPKTWLTGILKNKIADHYRNTLRKNRSAIVSLEELAPFFDQEGRWAGTAAPTDWPEENRPLTDNPLFNRILEECIDRLPEIMNACIRLKFLDEKKGEQVCQELGLTTTNYWQIIHRGKLHLRDCLEKNWFRTS